MHYRRLGRSGLKVSEISLGAWVTFGSQLQEQSAVNLFHAAYDQGINFFDNADMYADGLAETVMGKAMAGLPRQALVISSKVFFPTFPGPNGKGLSRKHIIDSVHVTLKRLDTDYLDLYFCHRFDPDSPMEEVVRTMTDLVSQGKVMYWGTSKWTGSQITSAIAVARQFNGIPPTVEQCRYNMLDRRSVEVDLSYPVKEFGLGLTPSARWDMEFCPENITPAFLKAAGLRYRKWPGSRTGSHPKRSARYAVSGWSLLNLVSHRRNWPSPGSCGERK
jgi:aryl-alcohol dehydrogenase-like predicted oxidoreductase